MGDWNSEALEVNIWMETQGLTNAICNIHRYSDYPITYQRSKDFSVDGIYCSDSLAANRGGFLSFGRLVRYHQSLWIKTNKNRLLGFRQNNIIPPMARILCLAYPRTIFFLTTHSTQDFLNMPPTRKSTMYMSELSIHYQYI